MSAAVRAHRPVREHPLTQIPNDLTGAQMALVAVIVLGVCVLAMHLVAVSSGGAW